MFCIDNDNDLDYFGLLKQDEKIAVMLLIDLSLKMKVII